MLGKKVTALLLVFLAAILLLACTPLEGDIDTIRGKILEKNSSGSTFTVSFIANNGTPAPDPQTIAKGGAADKPAVTRTGYTLEGWYRESTFATEWNFDSDVVNGNITLYAKWKAITYTIVYDKNAGDAGGTTVNSSHTYDAAKALTANGYGLSGYRFAGWALTQGGPVEFTDGESVKNLSATAGATVTLYAKWGGDPYYIAYVSNGGTGTMTNSTFTFGVEQTIKANAYTRAGYSFAGWAGTADGSVEYSDRQSVIDLAASAGTTVTLYARWGYAVTFNANDGTPAPAQQIVLLGGKATQTPAMTRTGYTFGGWYKESALINEWDFDVNTVSGNTTLYARWYSAVTFGANNATGGTAPSLVGVNAGSSTTLPGQGTLTKSGYFFGGWNTNSACTGTNYSAGASYTPIGNITLYAKWYDLPEMVFIAGGTFRMGSPATEPGYSGENQRYVTLTQGFYIGKYQVTQAQYQAVMGTNPSYFKTPISPETSTASRPVEQVSWYDAIVFCNKLSMSGGLTPAYRISGSTDPAVWGSVPTSSNAAWNAVVIVAGSNGYRLPTEAQWEYACRAGTTTAFNWGTNYINSTQANYNASNVDTNNLVAGTSLNRTTEVRSYTPNAWGLYDMHGNVWEWCWDWFANDLGSGAQTDPGGAVSGIFRSIRGGAWNRNGIYARSASRYGNTPNDRLDNIGFRLVRP